MRVVGTPTLGAARVPGVAAASRAADLVVAVVAGARAVAEILARVVTALLRLRPLPVVVSGGQLAARVAGLAPPGLASGGGPVTGPDRTLRCREVVLPADPTAPRQARAVLAAAAQEWGLDDDLHEDAAMVVTELVANAVDHARTPSTLTIDLDERGLRIAVRDECRGPTPRPRPVDPTASRGRGLQMIDALAASWGVTGYVDGKTVWAVLPPS